MLQDAVVEGFRGILQRICARKFVARLPVCAVLCLLLFLLGLPLATEVLSLSVSLPLFACEKWFLLLTPSLPYQRTHVAKLNCQEPYSGMLVMCSIHCGFSHSTYSSSVRVYIEMYSMESYKSRDIFRKLAAESLVRGVEL